MKSGDLSKSEFDSATAVWNLQYLRKMYCNVNLGHISLMNFWWHENVWIFKLFGNSIQ